MFSADNAKLIVAKHLLTFSLSALTLSDKHENRGQKIGADRSIKGQLKQSKDPDAHKYTHKYWPECMARHGFTLQE